MMILALCGLGPWLKEPPSSLSAWKGSRAIPVGSSPPESAPGGAGGCGPGQCSPRVSILHGRGRCPGFFCTDVRLPWYLLAGCLPGTACPQSRCSCHLPGTLSLPSSHTQVRAAGSFTTLFLSLLVMMSLLIRAGADLMESKYFRAVWRRNVHLSHFSRQEAHLVHLCLQLFTPEVPGGRARGGEELGL